MEKEFIPYKQALALKELGFDEDCFGCYTEKKEVIVRVGDYRSFQNNDSEDVIIRDFNSYENGTASAPTFSQAFRWFRDKHGLKSWVEEYNKVKFIYQIRPHKITDYKKGEVYVYKIYQEAELACLKKLIEIVNNK